MAEKIRVLLVEPMEKPRLVEIEHELEKMQELVDGYIQVLYPWEDPVGLVCDDEGLFKQSMPNRALVDEEGNPYDIVKGTFFVCGLTEDSFCSLSDEMAEKFMERFRWPEMFMRTMDNHVVWVRMKPGEKPVLIA